MNPNKLIHLEIIPSRTDEREAPGLRTSNAIHPTVAAYSRANPFGLFAIASARAAGQTASAPHPVSVPLNVPLTVATSVALATLIPIALRQLHAIRSLPEPSHRLFNSDHVVTSKSAKPLGIPDSLLGFASYGATLALVLLAPKSPTARKLVGPKLAVDATMVTVNTVRQFTNFRRVCSWCLLTVAATAAMAITGRKQIRHLI